MANIFGIEFPPTGAAPTPPVSLPTYGAAQGNPTLALTTSYQQADFTVDLGSSGVTVDTTAGTIEIVTAGKYLVSFTAVCNNTGLANENIDIRLKLNGSDFTPYMYGAVVMLPATAETVSFSNLCDLTAGDIINCEALAGAVGNANVISINVWLYKLA